MDSSLPARGDRGRRKNWDGAAAKAAFDVAAQTKPWTVAYQSFDDDSISSRAEIHGRLPDDLRGALYRNGPARHERGGQRYGHRWDGDGMIQKFTFSGSGVSHLGRFVQTDKYVKESLSDRFLVSAFGTSPPGAEPIPTPLDSANSANINVVRVAGELLALWEPGSAYRVDEATLMTRGRKTWAPQLVDKPFSAHPRIEASGELWNFGADPLAGQLTVYHAAPDGRLLQTHSIKLDRLPPTHDFAVTAHYLVFLLSSMEIQKDRLMAGLSFAESCQWLGRSEMRVMTVDKRDWSTRFYSLPAGCVFHISNAWEDPEGIIRLEYMRAAQPMSLLAGWTVMRGEYRHYEAARLTSVVIHPGKGTATQYSLGTPEAEFPVIESAHVGHRHRNVLCLERSDARSADSPGFDQIALINVETGDAQRFVYGDEWLVEEHVFASRLGMQRSDWIVGTAIDLRARQTVLSVFEANGISNGPMLQARFPYALPLGLHGSFHAAQPQ